MCYNHTVHVRRLGSQSNHHKRKLACICDHMGHIFYRFYSLYQICNLDIIIFLLMVNVMISSYLVNKIAHKVHKSCCYHCTQPSLCTFFYIYHRHTFLLLSNLFHGCTLNIVYVDKVYDDMEIEKGFDSYLKLKHYFSPPPLPLLMYNVFFKETRPS